MYGFILVSLFLLSSGISNDNEGSNTMHERPPIKAAQSEKRIETAQIAALQNTEKVRALVVTFEHALLESEEVTYDEGYGFIYRYDVEGSAQDGASGEGTYKGRLVITAKASGELSLVYGSLFELP